jgi:hypothetical protein
MIELERPEDYFPYIGHDLDPSYIQKARYYILLLGDLCAKENISYPDADTIDLNGLTGASVFGRVRAKGMEAQMALSKSNTCSELIVTRHRTLYDYCIGQPVHNRLINPNVIIIAGNNLFVSQFDWFLRKYGAFMFLREDVTLRKKGFPDAFLSQKRYLDEVFPAYMKQQMFDGVGPEKAKMDVICYAEQEKDPVTKKRSGGRTKNGKLRNLSHIFFDKLKGLSKESDTQLYVVPVNISFSKYPEVPYLVHPSRSKGLWKGIRYILEQSFVFVGYPKYSHVHKEARLDVTVNYGKPEILDPANFNSMRDLLHYSSALREKIGLLETIYPLTLLFRSMDADPDVSFSELTERAKIHYERYAHLGLDTGKISDTRGNLLPIEELAERGAITLNSNPNLYIRGVDERSFLSMSKGMVRSHDPKLQWWYANSLRHLDHDHGCNEET